MKIGGSEMRIPKIESITVAQILDLCSMIHPQLWIQVTGGQVELRTILVCLAVVRALDSPSI